MATWLTTSAAFGAQVEPSDYERLLKEANERGVASVLVTIDDTLTLEAIGNMPAEIKAEMEQKAQPLLAELGQDALDAGYWNNGMGQIGLYVTASGLDVLANSSNAITFMPDVTHTSRIRAYDADGSLDAIEDAINANGFADVEVFLNVDEGDYDIDRDGKTTFRPSPGLSKQIMSRLTSVNGQGFAKGFRNYDTRPSRAAVPSPSFRVRADKNTFYGLRESDDVRAIRPLDFVDSRPAQWPTDALAAAEASGSADVIVTLRGGAIFSPKTGFMSATALKAQVDANHRALDDVLTSAGASPASSAAATYFGLGSIEVHLPHAALARLYKNADPRILSIELNKPAAWPTLTNSTTLLNMQNTWNAGYRAAGQAIIVIDSGIRKDHELFKMNGATKVGYEACFGTNGWDTKGIYYNSICPGGQNGSPWDSTPGTLGSGEPYSNLAICTTLQNLLPPLISHDCSHGTHVAGIAAGRSPTNPPTTLQGVAPDAGLVAVQVFSYNTTVPAATAFGADLLAALDAVKAAATPGTTNNPFVVNMSIGGAGVYSANCDTANGGILTNAIHDLTSRGIPVTVATGNNGDPNPPYGGSRNGISWPACVSQAIKVSSVANDTGTNSGTTLAGFANIGAPANFTGPILLAPGGSNSTLVTSADRATTTATKPLRGTSQASPHAAGIYAAIKAAVPGISVADATAWIVATGSIPVTYTLPAPVGTQTYRRIKMPF